MGKTKILCVDDEKQILSGLQRRLRRESEIELIVTADPREAVLLAKQHDVDVVLADYFMPGLSGLAILDELRRVHPRARRVLVTGYDHAPLKAQVLQNGIAHHVLVK